MSRRCWLLLVLVVSVSAEEATPAPVRHGLERDGISVVVDVALPRLAPEQALQVQALACTTIPGFTAGQTLTDWVAREHAELAGQHADLAAAHPDAAVLAGWNHTIAITTTWSGQVISLQREDQGFSGGNHGWLTLAVVVIDAQRLRVLTLDDLIAPGDQPAFAALLTEVWRHQQRLRPDQRLSEHGLFVDELPARLPLITASGIEMIYQPYDIGPWSTGTVRVALTREQARPFLRRDPWAK